MHSADPSTLPAVAALRCNRRGPQRARRQRPLRAGALLLLLLAAAGCGGDLQIWHTRVLSAEYDSGKADTVRTLADYRALETALFEELDQRIYADTPAGPDHALQRYSSGSRADPRGAIPDWNRTVELGVGNTRGGVLLLHGMSDSPYSLRALGTHLADRGYRVLALRMPGHGTIPSGLTRVKWRDMAAVTRIGAAHLIERLDGAPLHIVGYSTGAALAIDYALQAQPRAAPASLVLISPAVGLRPAAALAGWKRAMSYIPGLRRLAWSGLDLEFDPYKYNSFATNAAEQVYRITRSINRHILEDPEAAQRVPPTLVMMSAVDATVSIDAVVDRYLVHLARDRHELVIFDVNRLASIASIMRDDPGPITRRLLQDRTLPFAVTLVGNAGRDSEAVVAAYKPPLTEGTSRTEALGTSWPAGVFSLSHVALPFPPTDPLYGQYPPEDRDRVFLGYHPMQGERDVLSISTDFLLRLRHNPFYDYLEQRTQTWIESGGNGGPAARSGKTSPDAAP